MNAARSRLGARLALIVSALTAVTFATAVMTPPLGGPWCVAGCFAYPYADIAARFPRDYWWMFPAIPLSLLHVALWSVLVDDAPPARRTVGRIALVMAALSAVVLVDTYWVQLAVVPASLAVGEHDGIPLLTQFNPHGLFIAREELGYLLMAVSFACMVPVFAGSDGLSRTLRIVFGAALPASLLALGVVAARYGLEREYRFEVAAITVDWLTLLVGSGLLVAWFRRRARAETLM